MMPALRGIVICVNYDDLLNITLPRNMRHLSECLVITSSKDERTKRVCAETTSVRVHETEAFYKDGARFNKGAAMEEGFDILGREGWILIWDADTLFPNVMSLDNIQIGNLYGPPRRILEDATKWSQLYSFQEVPLARDKLFPGYFQLFHADDPIVRDHRPWYDTTFIHAGGADGHFQDRWPWEQRIRLPFEVLHLGPRDTNWFGRASSRVDGQPLERAAENWKEMHRYRIWRGWERGTDPRSVAPFDEHLKVL